MIVPIVTLTALLSAGAALAADDSGRDKLMGMWEQSDGNGEPSTWTLEGKSGFAGPMHVTNSHRTQTQTEFECNTLGMECSVQDAGKASKVSLWFNGAKLVELETRGTQVVKRRFCVTGDGDTMDLETIPIVPAGKAEITHFKRSHSAAALQ